MVAATTAWLSEAGVKPLSCEVCNRSSVRLVSCRVWDQGGGMEGEKWLMKQVTGRYLLI